MTIVTLIAAGTQGESLAILRERLDRAGIGYGDPVGVGPDISEVSVNGDVSDVREVIDVVPGTDVFVQDEENRPPILFVADMDSTMIGQECIDELAKVAGVGDRVAEITERAMQGELDFEASLRARLALLEGLDVAVIDRLLAGTITPNPGGAELVADLKASGVRCVLVSGGFTLFADPVGERLGFDRVVANRLAVSNGKLTGTVEGEIVGRETKRVVLLEEAKGDLARTVAIGDGANDLAMLDAAGLGIAYRAKPAVAAAADARLDHHDLSKLSAVFGLKR